MKLTDVTIQYAVLFWNHV